VCKQKDRSVNGAIASSLFSFSSTLPWVSRSIKIFPLLFDGIFGVSPFAFSMHPTTDFVTLTPIQEPPDFMSFGNKSF
jgi:hypothetical protein